MNTEKFIGQIIGRYRIVRHIARGGMADVYEAEDVDLKRKVALKIMLDALAEDSQFVLRFRREAQTVARLDHPNIVQIYTVGEAAMRAGAAERPYIAMQYIEGGSLREKLQELARRGKLLTTEQALNITRQIAEALAMAHKANVIHRDLKPSNVLIRPDGRPVLVDLGIAVVEGVSKLTQTGAIIGTPHYMSPEQVKGERLDGRSDLYSLGVILYEMLAGIRPFEADSSVAVLHQQVYEEPVPMQKRRPDLPPPVTAVVAKSLQKEPSRRFQQADEMIAAIDQALQMGGARGPNPQATSVLTHLSDSSLISRQQFVQVPTGEREPPRQPAPAPQRAPPQRTAVPAPPPAREAERRRPAVPVWAIVTMAVLAAAVILMFGSQLFGGEEAPPAVDEATAVPQIVVMTPTDAPTTDTAVPPTDAPPTDVPPTDVPPTAVPPTATPSLQNKIAFQSNRDGDFEIYIMNSDGTNQIQLTNNSVDDNYPVASLDGSRILFESFRDGNWEVYAINVDGTGLTRLTNAPDSKDRLPTWSPDGRQVAFISDRDGDYDIYIMNADGSNVRQVTYTDRREGHMSWSVDNRLVYNAGTWDDDTWEIYTIDTNGQNQRQLTSNGISDWAPEWSPDGRTILYLTVVGNDDPAIFVMNADGSNSRMLYNSQYYEWGADWAADGSQIVFTKDENNLANLYIMNADGSNVRLISSRAGYPSWVK